MSNYSGVSAYSMNFYSSDEAWNQDVASSSASSSKVTLEGSSEVSPTSRESVEERTAAGIPADAEPRATDGTTTDHQPTGTSPMYTHREDNRRGTLYI